MDPRWLDRFATCPQDVSAFSPGWLHLRIENATHCDHGHCCSYEQQLCVCAGQLCECADCERPRVTLPLPALCWNQHISMRSSKSDIILRNWPPSSAHVPVHGARVFLQLRQTMETGKFVRSELARASAVRACFLQLQQWKLENL